MRERIKRILAAALCIGMLHTVPLYANAETAAQSAVGIESVKIEATGVSYLNYAVFASKISAIAGSGQCGLYADPNRTPTGHDLRVGSSMNTSYKYYAVTPSGACWNGYQCYIYSQGVYGTLFDELPTNGSGPYSKSEIVIRNVPEITPEILRNAKVMPGAYFRSTGNSDGSYNGSVGHSLVILGYDDTTVTLIEGNANNKGLISMSTKTYAEFNQWFTTGQGRRVCHVIQPKAEVYQQMYGMSYPAAAQTAAPAAATTAKPVTTTTTTTTTTTSATTTTTSEPTTTTTSATTTTTSEPTTTTTSATTTTTSEPTTTTTSATTTTTSEPTTTTTSATTTTTSEPTTTTTSATTTTTSEPTTTTTPATTTATSQPTATTPPATTTAASGTSAIVSTTGPTETEAAVTKTNPLRALTAPTCEGHRLGYCWALSVPKSSSVLWFSSNPDVVSVTGDGIVTANANGFAVVSAVTEAARYDFPFIISSVSWELLGDANMDGSVDCIDAQFVLKDYVHGLSSMTGSTLNAFQQCYADVDDDGLITSKDAQLILQFYVYQLSQGSDFSAMGAWQKILL